MRMVYGAVVVALLLAVSCSDNDTVDSKTSGGDAAGQNTAGASGGVECPPVGCAPPDAAAGGTRDVAVDGAGASAGTRDAGGGTFGGSPIDGCTGFESNFGQGEGGASYGSASGLAALVGTWRFQPPAPDDGFVFVWTIKADGTASLSEHRPAVGSQPATTTLYTGTLHVGKDLLVLEVTEETITTPSGTSPADSISPQYTVAYDYDAEADPNTLGLSVPDCGSLSFDAYERQ